jgi:hypothetical protein
MGDERAVPRQKRGGVRRTAGFSAEAASSPGCASAMPMTKSPARSSSRPSASARSCGKRSPGAVEDESDHAKLQLARLTQAMQIASMAIADGDVKAIPPLVKVLDRLDRYQRAANVNQVYDDEARKRLMDKINRVAANLGEGPAQNSDSGQAAGQADGSEKTAWGVGASL